MFDRIRRRSKVTLLCGGAVAIVAALLLGQRGDRDEGGPNGAELLRNGSFEQAGNPLPQGWSQDRSQTGDKGTIRIDASQARTGVVSLKLEPNGRNGGSQPLAISQVIDVSAYRGRKVWFGADLKSEGGAGAVLAVLSLVKGKPGGLAGTGQPQGAGGWVRKQQIYTIPDDPSVQLVVVCSVNGTGGAAWFDDVSVRLDAPAQSPVSATASGPMRASIRVDTHRIVRQLPDSLFGANVEWIWNGNLLWQERERKPDARLLQLTKELGPKLLRYPGGYYSDYYHWKNGVGDPGQRPEMVHDGTGRERSRAQFGTDEALAFAAMVGAELMITVNAGTGTAQEAAGWVRYVNGKGTRVRYWEIGNELYIDDGSPISRKVAVDPQTYAKRFREFAQAMKAVDPSIRIGGIGGENRGAYAFVKHPSWNRTVLREAGDLMDFFAIHNAYAPVSIQDNHDLEAVYRAMLASPLIVARNLEVVARQIAQYSPKPMPIAVTEWGPLFQVDPKGAYADHTKTLGSALYCASAFKVMIESPQTEIANFHVLNDLGIMGWIGSTNPGFPPKPEWNPTARYYSFLIFSRYFGRQLTATQTTVPVYHTPALGAVDAVRDVPLLDVTSSLSKDRSTLYVVAINKSFDRPIETDLDVGGFTVRKGEAWTLTGSGIDAHTGTQPLQAPGLNWGRQKQHPSNPRFSKGGPEEVTFSSRPLAGVKAQFRYTFPPHSVTSLVLRGN